MQHLIELRELEIARPGFFAFIPLAFQPGTTGLVRRQASAIEDLKTIAISRLVFDNVPHVKSYWIMLGQDTAGVGAATSAPATWTARSARRRSRTPRWRAARSGMAEAGMVQTIREAGKTPVQRDALYRVMREYPTRPAIR